MVLCNRELHARNDDDDDNSSKAVLKFIDITTRSTTELAKSRWVCVNDVATALVTSHNIT